MRGLQIPNDVAFVNAPVHQFNLLLFQYRLITKKINQNGLKTVSQYNIDELTKRLLQAWHNGNLNTRLSIAV